MCEQYLNYSVSFDGKMQNVRTAKINPIPYNSEKEQEFVICKFKGVNSLLEITSLKKISDVVIRPLSAKIKFSFDGHTVRIYLDKAMNFSVEINGSAEDNLLVFCNEEKEYSLENYKVINIAEDCKKDIILIDEDNIALVIDDGVTLNSKIEINGCKNVKICGSGIATQSGVSDSKYRICLDILGCENISVEDITITESLFWCLRILGCDNVKIKNVKIIGYRGNNDGIDVCGSRNVEVDGAFIRTWDDSFVVKAVDERDKNSEHYVFKGSETDITKAFENAGDVYNIIFKNSILWNDFARPIEIGVSLRADSVHNIFYKNIDIIHSTTGYPIIGAHHGDRAEVYDVTFDDIRIEDTPGAQIFDFRITDSVWSTDDKKGCMHDFLFKNIRLLGKPGIDILPEASRLEGYSKENSIRNFRFENIEFLGRAVRNAEQCNIDILDYVYDIEFKNSSCKDDVPVILSTLKQIGEPVCKPNENFDVDILMTLENKSYKKVEDSAYIKISPKNSGIIKSRTKFALMPGEKEEYRFKGEFPAGKHLLSVESQNIGVKSSKLLLDLPLYSSDDINRAKAMYFTNYYGDVRPPVYVAVHNNTLILKSEIIKQGELILYTANPVRVRMGEVLFTAEETDFGETTALVMGKNGPVSAPQLRCPAEITYVFHNEPKVEKINKIIIPKNEDGIFKAKFHDVGINENSNEFLMEIQVNDKESKQYRYAFTLGHSVWPYQICHMFLKVIF